MSLKNLNRQTHWQDRGGEIDLGRRLTRSSHWHHKVVSNFSEMSWINLPYRGPGDSDKKSFDLENGIPYYELDNTIW